VDTHTHTYIHEDLMLLHFTIAYLNTYIHTYIHIDLILLHFTITYLDCMAVAHTDDQQGPRGFAGCDDG
jgi:hypothetical protein